MKECMERHIELGFKREAAEILDEVEKTSDTLKTQGWNLIDSCIEEGFGYIHLFFEREIQGEPDSHPIGGAIC